MALPPTIRVKLSSEAAESISLTPVVVQELPVRDLIEHMLGVTGQGRGADSRAAAARHAGERRIAIPLGGMGGGAGGRCARCWRHFPIPTPRAPSRAAQLHCARRCAAAGSRSRSRARPERARVCSSGRPFGMLLMEVIAGGGPGVFAGYSYRERADRYLRELTAARDWSELRAARASWCSTARCAIRSRSGGDSRRPRLVR